MTSLTTEWISKGEDDYDGAVDLNLRRKRPLHGLVCYLSQQCAEKYLKAFLSHHGQSTPFTHDLPRLLQSCIGIDPTLTALSIDATLLDNYSVMVRYPGFTALPVNAQDSMAAVRRVRRTIRRKLGL